jgi:hypothetical protein
MKYWTASLSNPQIHIHRFIELILPRVRAEISGGSGTQNSVVRRKRNVYSMEVEDINDQQNTFWIMYDIKQSYIYVMFILSYINV